MKLQLKVFSGSWWATDKTKAQAKVRGRGSAFRSGVFTVQVNSVITWTNFSISQCLADALSIMQAIFLSHRPSVSGQL